MSIFKKAFGGGFRAGMAEPRFTPIEGGLKRIASPVCPYTGKWQTLLRRQWETGWHTGMMKRLTRKER